MTDEQSNEQLTPEEKDEIKDILGYGANVGETKHNVHTFLTNVVTAKDTTKLGFLKDEELGSMTNPVRAWKFLGSFSKDIMKKDKLAEFFNGQSEIGTSTSLSRDGKLISLAVVQRREIADVTKKRKPSSSWFKKKDDSTQNEEEKS